MTILNDFRDDETRVLDRLADGELSGPDRRELLAALDDEPGAWRRCALAFLESQNWRQQLSQLAVEPNATVNITASNNSNVISANGTPTGRGQSRVAFWGMCLAAAASVLVAFAAGTRFPVVPYAQPSTAQSQLAVAVPAADNGSAAPVDTEVADQLDSSWQTVKLALAGNGDVADEIDLPVADATDDDAAWPVAQESTLPANLIEKLRQAGLEVVRRQRLVPVDMSDGRRLMVPVEQVDIRSPEFVQSL